jgi:hypothetical protein
MYIVLDDFIPQSYADILLDEFEKNVSWTFTPSASNVDKNYDINDINIRDSIQFVHPIAAEDQSVSSLFSLVIPLVWFLEKETGLKIKSIGRIKANCLTRDGDEYKYNPPHVDVYNPGHISMIYYLDDSDGDTIVFDQYSDHGHSNLTITERIIPKKGRALVLHSDRFHASSCPVTSKKRMVINFILAVESE